MVVVIYPKIPIKLVVLLTLVLAVSVWSFNLQSLPSGKDINDDFCDNITETASDLLLCKKTPKTLKTNKPKPKSLPITKSERSVWSQMLLE